MSEQIKVRYKTGVFMPAIGDWRSVWVRALATPSRTGKMLTIDEVILVAGEEPVGRVSATGARRQTFNAKGIAEREKGKRKQTSACIVLTTKNNN